MILIFDICYNEEEHTANAACIKFPSFDSKPTDYNVYTYTKHCENVADYESGNFYKRELPCIMSLLNDIGLSDIDYIITDSYVEFSDEHLGLGKHLYNKLDKQIPVIGIAKNKFKSENISVECHRGESHKPLYITAAGISNQKAAELVSTMHGEFRLPDMVKAVDHLCRYNKID